MLHRIPRRWLAGLGAAFTAVAVAPGAPAAAAAPDNLVVNTADVAVSPGGYGSAGLYAEYPGGELVAEKITFDISEITGYASVQPDIYGFYPYTCETADSVITCVTDAPSVGDESWINLLDFSVTLAENAVPGTTGQIHISVQAGDQTAGTAATVTVTEPVNLAAVELPEYTASPGETVATPLAVKNVGDTTIDGYYLVFNTESGVSPTEKYSNCRYQTAQPQVGVFGNVVHCAFDQTIAPGQTVRVPDSYGFTIAEDSWAPISTGGYFSWLANHDYEGSNWGEGTDGSNWEQGTGPALTLQPVNDVTARRLPQQDVDQNDNNAELTIKVTGDQQADVVAIGATVTADKGATVTATLAVRNAGPARLNGEIGGWMPNSLVTIPEGVTVLSADPLCRPIIDGDNRENWQYGEPGQGDGKLYLCWPGGPLLSAQTVEYPFELKVEGDFAKSTGAVVLRLFNNQSAGEGKDLDAGNNTAALVVNSNGSGVIEGGGEGGGGGTLPITGAKAGLIGAAGALLLVAGAGGFLLARRRRTAFVA